MEKDININKTINKSTIIALCSLFIVSFFLFAFLLWQGVYSPKNSNLTESKDFLIQKGQGVEEISLKLEKEGFIRNKYFFVFYVLFKNKTKNLQSGRYLLSPAMTVEDIAKKIISGDVAKEKITIIEGWDLEDIGRYFENKKISPAENFFKLAGFPKVGYSEIGGSPKPNDFIKEFSFLKDKPENLGLEGYFYPDTYYIEIPLPESENQTIEEVIKKTLNNFDKKLTNELREEIKKRGKTIFETITMASLVEKEVKTFEDKKLVSGILWKRLKADMPLQVDATIVYALGKKTTKVSKEETRIDSPYNTYKYRGLPLGPISNPGLESILAAVYPEDSGYWYYLSTPEGRTIFNGTLEGHNKAKALYLK